MAESRNLLVGMDICKDYTQICFYNHKTHEPESVALSADKTKYIIPTMVGVKTSTKAWVYGEEAISCESTGNGIKITGLLELASKNQTTVVLGTNFSPDILLEKFIRKCLQLLKVQFPTEYIGKLVITVKDLNENLKMNLYKALNHLGIESDRALVQSHSSSYLYYALSQKKELWLNDVALFDFSEEGLFYQQISINRRRNPYLVGINEKNFNDIIDFEEFYHNMVDEKKAYFFSNVAKKVLHKQLVSTIYVTGKGFDGSWSDSALKELCVTRRVFKGQNLYVKGACYAARELKEDSKLKEFLFLDNDTLTSEFSIQGYKEGKNSDVILIKEPLPWYEINCSLDIILDEEEKITIKVKDLLNLNVTSYPILLDELPKRPNMTTRIALFIKFKDKNTAVVTVKDKGFGDFFPSSGISFEREINIMKEEVK